MNETNVSVSSQIANMCARQILDRVNANSRHNMNIYASAKGITKCFVFGVSVPILSVDVSGENRNPEDQLIVERMTVKFGDNSLCEALACEGNGQVTWLIDTFGRMLERKDYTKDLIKKAKRKTYVTRYSDWILVMDAVAPLWEAQNNSELVAIGYQPEEEQNGQE